MGFFTGHEDFRICTDPTADISVTFVHRSLEEFFGSFGFLKDLDDGKSIDEILGSDCEEPIFMVNPLVLIFCLWLLTTNLLNFQRNIYQQLVLFATKRIDFHLLDIEVVEQMYPAMNISDPLLHKDSLKLKFFWDTFEACKCVRFLHIERGKHQVYNKSSITSLYDKVDRVLGLMSCDMLSKLTRLALGNHIPILPIHRDAFVISADCPDPQTLYNYLSILLPKYNLLKSNPQVYARVECHESHDLSTLMTKDLKELILVGENNKKLYLLGKDKLSSVTLFMSGKFPNCPKLTNITLEGCHLDNSVPSAFMKAVQNGDLPHLKRIELVGCTVSDCEWPAIPEFSFKTEEMLDLLEMKKLLSKQTELIVNKPSDIVISMCLEKLLVLRLEDIDSHTLPQIDNILTKGILPNLSKLSVTAEHRSRVRLHNFLGTFDPDQTVKLEKLALRYFILSSEEMDRLCEKLASIQLTELDLSSSGFTFNLSVLFTHIFPRLNKLIMSHCGLNANDLQSLARANVEGKLPQLRHLDISTNSGFNISDLFTHSAHWDQLTTLETSDVNVLNVDPECLTSLEELFLPAKGTQPPSVTRQWPCLKLIEVNNEQTARCIADGVEQGMFPSLATVRCESFYYGRPFFFKLLKVNISVEQVS